MKVGFFGGSFDPIHFGHINLAIQLLEAHGLDQVIFCPTGLSPHKQTAPPVASARNRRIMVEKAIENIPFFTFCDFEIMSETVSFTIDTLRHLSKIRSNDQFHLLLGEDALFRFEEWKDYKKIIALAPPLVGSRPQETDKQSLFITTPIHSMDISSTYLRDRLKKRLYCGHLVPSNVLDYIYANKLYFFS